MPENMNHNDTASPFQLETLEQLFGNLTGLNKWVAQKILHSGFIEEIKKTLNRTERNEINNALKKLVEMAIQQTTNALGRKVAFILTIIAGVFTFLVVIVTLVAGGNVVIPIMVSIILIAIIWFVMGKMSKLIATRVSGMVFEAIEGKITQFIVNNRLVP